MFLVVSPTATTSPNFQLKGVAGRTGRLDVIARSIVSAFKSEKGFRRNVVFYALLLGPPNPPKLLVIDGRIIEAPPSSEREALLMIKNVLGGKEIRGVHVESWGFKHILNHLLKITKNIYYLKEDGILFEKAIKPSKYNVFVLGSHLDLPREYEQLLDKYKVPRVSLGKTSYLTSQCITIVHWLLDVMESSLYT